MCSIDTQSIIWLSDSPAGVILLFIQKSTGLWPLKVSPRLQRRTLRPDPHPRPPRPAGPAGDYSLSHLS